MRRLIPLVLFVAVSISAQNIAPERIAAHMRFLASDLLEGRGTATRGHLIAAQYVAAQYEALGLEPGANGSWFQSVPFRKTTPIPDQSSITIGSTTLAFGSGFVSNGDPLEEDARAEGSVIFVGYGITAPSQKRDDYAGVDAHGRIVAYFTGAPKNFPSDVRAHYSSSLVKFENAAAHGAIGVLTLRTSLDETRSPWARSVRQSKLGAMNWLERIGAPHATFPQLGATATLSHAGALALLGDQFDSLDKAMDAGEVKSFKLANDAAIHIASKHETVQSPNVAGILRGSDPKLRDEYIVYSAHLDHLGISEPVDGDSINNGALDNASGVASILEIARAFASAPARPKRSILFLATTAEEKGLRGADYFANNPTVPLQSIVADINVDEIFMFHPVKDIVPIGGEHSTLGDTAARVAKSMGLLISPDPQPEEVVFVRSDQYPFVKRGVPAIYVGSGYKAVDPRFDIQAEAVKWEETIYHSPKDDMSQPIDFTVGATVAKFNYLLGLDVANAASRPQWKKGDFFGDMFGK
jgi:Zn-dependent M28 family amino/carboxypeptidase